MKKFQKNIWKGFKRRFKIQIFGENRSSFYNNQKIEINFKKSGSKSELKWKKIFLKTILGSWCKSFLLWRRLKLWLISFNIENSLKSECNTQKRLQRQQIHKILIYDTKTTLNLTKFREKTPKTFTLTAFSFHIYFEIQIFYSQTTIKHSPHIHVLNRLKFLFSFYIL